MTALEDLLRESLHERAARPKLADDVAGTAIRGAHALRRRRITLVAAAGVLAILAAISGVTIGWSDAAPVVPATRTPAVTPSAVPGPDSALTRYGVHIDILEPGGTLRTVDGHQFDLGTAVGVIVRVPVGWLYGQPGQDFHLLRPDGSTLTLATANPGEPSVAGWPVPSADGTRVAWVAAGTLNAGRLTADGITDRVSSPVPADSFAATWIGDRVVVGEAYATGCCGYDHDQYDVWDPTKGDFVAHWTRNLEPIYGPVPVGVPAYADVPGATETDGCLGRLDGVANMSVTAKTCLSGLTYESLSGTLSSDGRWLVENDSDHDGSLMVIDLAANPEPARSAFSCGPGQALGWEDSTTLLVQNDDTMMRCDIGHRSVTAIPFGGVPVAQAAYRLVPHYGV